MHEDLHNDPFTDGSFVPHIPAAQAWQNMEMLLNTHLPAQTRKAVWWLTGLQVSAVVMLLLLVWVPLKDGLLPHIFPEQPQEKMELTPTRQVVAAGSAVATERYTYTRLPAIAAQPEATAPVLPAGNSLWAYTLNHTLPVVPATDTPVSTKAGAATDSVKKADPTPQKKRNWQLLAGLGTNYVAGNHTQHMVPYPTAELRYFITKRVYVAAGVSIGAPVASDEKTVEKTVAYYDQALDEMKTYNQIRSIDRAVYTDVPVTAGVQLGKHWSAATGVQLSFLNKIVSHRYAEPYNEQAMRQVMFTTGYVGPAAIVEDKPVEPPVPQKDFRGLAALTWQAGKWQVTGQYQHSFNQGQKNIVSLKLQFRLK
jgi:hypothetical protein